MKVGTLIALLQRVPHDHDIDIEVQVKNKKPRGATGEHRTLLKEPCRLVSSSGAMVNGTIFGSTKLVLWAE